MSRKLQKLLQEFQNTDAPTMYDILQQLIKVTSDMKKMIEHEEKFQAAVIKAINQDKE